MTTAEMILLAAADLDQVRDGESFTTEELAVRAWHRWPATFGLAGYPQYVATHRVCPKIYGSVGLIARGMLEVITTKVLRMTPAGRRRVAELQRGAA